MSSDKFFVLRDPDQQHGDDNYRFILGIWTPSGRQLYAVDTVKIENGTLIGLDEEGKIVTVIHSSLQFVLLPRQHCDVLNDEEAFEQEFEKAQAQQMRQARVDRVMNKGGNDGGYR